MSALGSAGRQARRMGGQEPASDRVPFDTSTPHIARVYNYWLGGKDNFAADRAAAEQVIATMPDVLVSVRAQRAFLGRAVHWSAASSPAWTWSSPASSSCTGGAPEPRRWARAAS
jgi:S-adenosyl methyltransferase